MGDVLTMPLTEAEERWNSRLKKMFPRREGGEVALEQTLRARNATQEAAVRAGSHVSAEELEMWKERVRRMYGPRTERRQLGLWDKPARVDAPNALSARDGERGPTHVAEPEWNETPLWDETETTTALSLWDTSTVLELEYPPDAPVVAVTPLDAAERDEYPFEYLVDVNVAEDDPARIVGVAVKYTREQLRLAMEVAKALTDETEEYVVHWD